MVGLWYLFLSWNSSHTSAVSDLTKSAELTMMDDSKDDYQYEEVIY